MNLVAEWTLDLLLGGSIDDETLEAVLVEHVQTGENARHSEQLAADRAELVGHWQRSACGRSIARARLLVLHLHTYCRVVCAR